MVQGGYVSQSNSKTLTVSKKNVLDKKPPKTNALHSSNNNNSTAVENSAPSVDVSTFYYWNFIQTIEHVTKKKHILTIFAYPFLSFPHTQENVLKEFTDELKRQNDEMRKLKAIIVKHENRIRSLEAAQKAREEDVLDSILYTSNADKSDDIAKTPSAGNLAPDEV